jgi:excinuclease ABC subunit C
LSTTAFDQKFGEAWLATVPQAPGVYRYLDAAGAVIYVGKAKNLRRRLSNYRNATGKKVHRKLRRLVKAAHSLNYEVCGSERAALLREGELIRLLKPAFNIDGAFAFLYPFLGLGSWDKHVLLCFTTTPEEFRALPLTWYGCFRSRPRVKTAFEALVALLSLIGHREKATRLPPFPKLRGSRLVGMRQLPSALSDGLVPFFDGGSPAVLKDLSRSLLDRPRALQDPSLVQEHLTALVRFFEADAVPLREALHTAGNSAATVSQAERDNLFIRATISE